MLRVAELGISIQDMDLLTVGMILDILNEKALDIDDEDTEREATEWDIENF